TIFRWPFMRSNLQRPDIPLESLRIGNDNSWGTSIESRWYLSRLLGLREPEGVDSRLNLDYFSKRGTGAGVEIEYEMDKYYGRIAGYVIRDSGEDRLGRDSSRKNIDAGNDIRGRFGWLHRHFLPYKWQLTTGIGYSSDENFIESFYRKEFNVSTQETYLHLKRIEDNRAISILGKVRINDFADELDQMPAFEYHLTGESLFNDTFTLYSDTQVARMRQRIGDRHTTLIDENMFTFGWQRMELDMPMELAGSLSAGRKQSVRVVPFIAGTFGYDDRSGFRSTLVDGSNTGSFGDKNVWLGELGVRVFPRPLWKEYPNVTSRLWDLNRLRHIIKPWVTAVTYVESDSVVKQRDTLNFGISQRLQTKRQGTSGARTIDWMRLDTEFTWVDDSASADTSAPDRFIWARPMVPLSVFSAPEIFSGDLTTAGLRRFEMFGPRRNYFAADYIWRLSDTAVIISDMNFDMQSGVVQQFNFGLSRLVWPDLSLFIGSRYLRNINILDQKGSNTFTFAATYVLDPRYTLVFSQQFDFDYGANIRSNITLLRKYHRMRYGFTYSADGSLDRQAIVLSIWPQGVPEMALGPRRYMGIGEESYLNR
ncbi:MAG: LPS-assembly protein LptD, partial [Planctomycetota bacterium]